MANHGVTKSDWDRVENNRYRVMRAWGIAPVPARAAAQRLTEQARDLHLRLPKGLPMTHPVWDRMLDRQRTTVPPRFIRLGQKT